MELHAAQPPGFEVLAPVMLTIALLLAAAVMWLPVATALLLVPWAIHRRTSKEPQPLWRYRPVWVIVVQALWALIMLGTAVTLTVQALNGTLD